MKSVQIVRSATAAYALALAVLSLLPSAPGRPGGWDAGVSPPAQNLLHVPAYAVLMVLAAGCLSPGFSARWAATGAVVLACAAYGTALEAAQRYIPGRTGSAPDALLNLAGVGLGVMLVVLWRSAPRPARPKARERSEPVARTANRI